MQGTKVERVAGLQVKLPMILREIHTQPSNYYRPRAVSLLYFSTIGAKVAQNLVKER